MKVLPLLAFSMLTSAWFAGCASSTIWRAKPQLGCAAGVVQQVLTNYGGQARLESVKTINAQAVVTWYDESGAGFVSSENLTIAPDAGWITSTGHLPGGNWKATVRLSGSASFQTTGTLKLPPECQERIASYLRLILHRVRGPLNLVLGGEKVAGSEEMLTAGVRAQRVTSTGRPTLATAYFFDLDRSELKLVTADGAAPPEKGTVTVYSNERLDNGLIYPVRLEIRSIGSNALLGQQKLLDVELKYLSFSWKR